MGWLRRRPTERTYRLDVRRVDGIDYVAITDVEALLNGSADVTSEPLLRALADVLRLMRVEMQNQGAANGDRAQIKVPVEYF